MKDTNATFFQFGTMVLIYLLRSIVRAIKWDMFFISKIFKKFVRSFFAFFNEIFKKFVWSPCNLNKTRKKNKNKKIKN